VSLLFRPFAVMIEYPWLAFLPGLLLLALHGKTHRPSALWAAVAWLLYGVYEYGMKWRVLCSGECNIRLDLMAVYPLLVAGSLFAVARALSALRRKRPDPVARAEPPEDRAS
jgi:hypothetical protein